MELKFASHQTQQINSTNVAFIKAKGCFKVDIRNDSPGTVIVNKCPIESGETKCFDGLPPGCVFIRDFDLDLSNAISVDVYATRYFYTNDPKDCTPIDHGC